ncbi:hypothetical protein POM88_052124 [Heracleum sosnowskyi]|uniref:Uncharacterized protein n=1 Tax=Heracleum sosnowskyi TaxID=360622 RepID=A0AAD8GT42_9APIA|nr:hypothetical protein POM88_052124 [Heracleum sosnowskyi]
MRGCKELECLHVRDCIGFNENDEDILKLSSSIRNFRCDGSTLYDDSDCYMDIYDGDDLERTKRRAVASDLPCLERKEFQEFLDWDMGLGIDHPDFRDVTDPVNFDVALGLVDRINIMSVGQGNAPQAVHHEVEMNAGHQVGGGEQEVLQGGAAANNEAFLFAGDLPLDDNDQVLVALLSNLGTSSNFALLCQDISVNFQRQKSQDLSLLLCTVTTTLGSKTAL